MLSPASLWSVYVSGNMTGGRVVAFYVLVPISYVLVLSAGILVVCRYYRYAFHVATAVALLGIFAMSMDGKKSQNLDLLAVGLLGISIGYIPIERINRWLKRSYLVVLAYLLYLAAITVWNVPYPLQVTGVLLTLMVIYLVGMASGDSSKASQTLIRLGKYSLFGYIAQIAILQILRRLLPMELAAWELVLSFLGAAALTVVSVETVDVARVKVPFVNRIYAAVFS